jgi:uncharacterized protein
VDRRDFIKFIAAGTGGALLYSSACTTASKPPTASPFFPYVRGPMPLATDGVLPARQAAIYANFDVVDDLALPEGINYEVIAVWGDRVGDSRFGYNNDYLSLSTLAHISRPSVINSTFASHTGCVLTSGKLLHNPDDRSY